MDALGIALCPAAPYTRWAACSPERGRSALVGPGARSETRLDESTGGAMAVALASDLALLVMVLAGLSLTALAIVRDIVGSPERQLAG